MARPAHRRLLSSLTLGVVLAALGGSSAGASPAGLGGPLGPGASDVSAWFRSGIKGLVHAAVLPNGSVRVRTAVRGADPNASYRVVGSATPCGLAPDGKARLMAGVRIMGGFASRIIPAGTLPDRTDLFASIRIVRVGGSQVGCAEALSYEPVPDVAAPALVLSDIVVSSFTRPGRPRGLLLATTPDHGKPQLTWSLTGLGDTSYRLVGSTAPCTTKRSSATDLYRTALLTKPYGFSALTGLDGQVRSFRILAKGGHQLACTGRGRHVEPLL